MLTRRGTGQKVRILAGGAVTGGTPRFEQGFVGIPEISCSSGSYYELALEGEYEIAVVGTPAVGDSVYITRATQVVGLSGGAGISILGKITAMPAGGFGAKEPPTGKMWIKLMPQQATLP